MSAGKISVLAEAVKAGLAGLGFLLLAAALGPGTYGTYAVFLAVSQLLLPFASVGINWWIQPLVVAEGVAAGLNASIRVLATITLGGSVVMTAIAVWILGMPPSDAILLSVLEVAAAPAWQFASLALLAGGKLRSYVAVSALIPLSKLVATFVCLYLVQGDLLLWAGVALVITLCGYAATLTCGGAFGENGRSKGPGWWTRGLSFASVGSVSALMENVDKVIVGALASTSAVGLYTAASRLALFGVVPVRGLSLVAYPMYFKHISDREPVKARALMRRTVVRCSLISAPVVVALPIGGYLISEFWLTEYSGFTNCLIVLSLLIPVKGLLYATGDTLYALGRARLRLASLLVAAALTILLTALGLTWFGIVGAAGGLVVATAVAAGLQLLICEALLKRQIDNNDGTA